MSDRDAPAGRTGASTPSDGLHVATPHAYRPDIDGLRALAVLPILFNHAGVRGFGGGYIGVDIFFVISGFLITGILLRDIESKRHSIAEFYRRRVLRIFPALFVMLAVVTVLSILALLPGELVRFARSMGATALFGSNFAFWAESGYFDVASRVKPLLHTWSLAIEEQFYILWPLLLAGIGVARRRVLAWTMVGVAAVSFAIAVRWVASDPSTAFYLLPSRAWELAIGGLLAMRPVPVRGLVARQAIGGIGLIVIALASWRFSAATPFPGIAALAPCLGAAALIAAGPDTLAGRLLSVRPLVWIGLISYSLYLWHWLVIVFADVGLLLPPSPAVIVAEIAASLLLAWASWKWIETPFRLGGRRWPTPAVLWGGAAAMALTLLVAGTLIGLRGLPSRFTPEEQRLAAWKDGDYEAYFRRGTCFVTTTAATLDPACIAPAADARPKVLLIGDSMAAHLWPGLSTYRSRYDILQATVAGCTPGIYPGGRAKCQRVFRDMLTRWVPEHRPAVVVLAGRWQGFDLPSLTETAAFLRARGVPVVVVGAPPGYQQDLPRLLTLARSRGDAALVDRGRDPATLAIDPAVARVAQAEGAAYVSLVGAWCRAGTCRTLVAPGVPTQFDYGHLTPQGSRMAAALVVPALDAAIARDRGRR